MKYKLNITRDVDTDEPDVFILNLPKGFKFTHDSMTIEHVRGYDSIKELREDIKHWVSNCDCVDCKN